jgi:SAM-dependent methyltransferase
VIIFPLLYHAHHSRHMEDLPFWLDLAARQEGPILELGCGSGRVLLSLARSGRLAVGLDNDPEMLALLLRNLRRNLRRSPPASVLVLQADLAAFHLGLRFGLVVTPCNTWSTLGAEVRLACLERVRLHLRPEGMFAASLPNPALLRRLPRRSPAEIEETFLHPLDGEPVQVSSAWERASGFFNLTWHYDHLLPDGRVERTSAQACHALTPAMTYLEELVQAGLAPGAPLGDFDGSPFTSDSPNLILIARKPSGA